VHGQKPETITIDHNINMVFAHAGIYQTQKFQGIKIVPVANIEGGLTWKAI
jgi:hypothetical protein